jgi:hypothetical protein
VKIGSTRKCDVCGAVIPPATTYNTSKAGRDAIQAFMKLEDPDLQPTWQEVGDGSGNIRLDICLEYSSQMGAGDRSGDSWVSHA